MIPGWVMPLHLTPQGREVLRGPPSPKVSNQQFDTDENAGSGRDSSGLPMRKCPGVKKSIPSSSTDVWERVGDCSNRL